MENFLRLVSENDIKLPNKHIWQNGGCSASQLEFILGGRALEICQSIFTGSYKMPGKGTNMCPLCLNSPNVRKRGAIMLLFCRQGAKERTWLATVSYPSSLSPSLWRQHFTVNLAVIASKMSFMVSDPAVNKAWNGGDTSIKLWTWTLFPQEWGYSRPLVFAMYLKIKPGLELPHALLFSADELHF